MSSQLCCCYALDCARGVLRSSGFGEIDMQTAEALHRASAATAAATAISLSWNSNESRAVMLPRSIVKQGCASTRTSSSYLGTTNRPRHQVGAERAAAAALWKQSNAARPRHTTATALEPLCLSGCRPVSIIYSSSRWCVAGRKMVGE